MMMAMIDRSFIFGASWYCSLSAAPEACYVLAGDTLLALWVEHTLTNVVRFKRPQYQLVNATDHVATPLFWRL